MHSFCVRYVLFILFLTSLSFGAVILTEDEIQQNQDIILSFKTEKNPNGTVTDEDILEEVRVLETNVDYYLYLQGIPSWAQFIVLQTHAYLHNVTLSYYIDKVKSKYVTGQNIGLVSNVTSNGTARFFLQNENIVDVTVLLVVVAYSKNAPVPGGCNMESSVAVAPWLGLNVTGSTVEVTSAPAQAPPAWGLGGTCDGLSPLHYQAYHMYLPETDFSPETYFTYIRKMLTVKRIIENGRKVPDLGANPLRHLYSAYHGTGTVFAVVVSSASTQHAAYVPALTYTCSPTLYTDTCQVLTSTFSRSLCATVLFIGLYVCLLGHSFFQTELFLFSTLIGGVGSYIFFAHFGFNDSGAQNTEPHMMLSTVAGIVFGLMWMTLWWLLGSPLLSVIMATIALGYLVAAVVYYTLLVDQSWMVSDLNYWLYFLALMLVLGSVCTTKPNRVNILACSIVGSYAAIVPLDHYFGGNLKYIFINTIRRASIEGFDEAVIDPPVQSKDILLTIAWVGLAITGFVMQSQRFGDRLSFPPSHHPWGIPVPPNYRRTPASERRPLLATSPGSDSVFS